MFGGPLGLMSMAVGESRRRLGDYMRKTITRYLVMSMAVIPLVAALAFAILAIYWAIASAIDSPIYSAAIMVGIMACAALLIVLTAYGITRDKPRSARQAVKGPVSAFEDSIPSVEDIGRQIEFAVERYGPFRVAAAAAAGGIVAGLLAKRFSQPAPVPPANDTVVVYKNRGRGRRETIRYV